MSLNWNYGDDQDWEYFSTQWCEDLVENLGGDSALGGPALLALAEGARSCIPRLSNTQGDADERGLFAAVSAPPWLAAEYRTAPGIPAVFCVHFGEVRFFVAPKLDRPDQGRAFSALIDCSPGGGDDASFLRPDYSFAVPKSMRGLGAAESFLHLFLEDSVEALGSIVLTFGLKTVAEHMNEVEAWFQQMWLNGVSELERAAAGLS